MKNYRIAFLISLIAAVIFASALGYLAWGAHRQQGLKRAPHAASAPAPTAVGGARTNSATSAPPQPSLAPVRLSPQRLQSIGVKTGVVQDEPVYNEIRTVGNVDVDEQLLSYVQLRFAGWIQQVFANFKYQHVRKGQPLFTVYSPDLVTTEREYLIARQNRNLLAASTVPGVTSGAESLLAAAAGRLKQWSVPAREISRLEKTGQVRSNLEIDSPVSGYITERDAVPHMYAQPETRLYAIANLSTVWVYANVFQNQIGQIKIGDPASVTVDSYPGRTFYGRVDNIWPEVDMTTRTVKVRLVFSNPGLKLSPGMFVNVDMRIPLGRHLAIPASGVLQTGTQDIVFVDRGQGYLEPRTVELGPQAGNEFIVLQGLKAGERIVTSANFLIDSESQLQAAIGSFMPPPPGAGAAAAMNVPAAQATIGFTTDPSPPKKGLNTLRVQLTAADGRPVAGAEVQVTFFMAAMPAMGMSAIRAPATLTGSSGGLYEGSINLQTGGAWQVTITAKKSGQVIASKQLTVDVGGGM